MSCTHHFVTCQHLEIHYTAWGQPEAPALVFWHGLTRTGRDFDELAAALSTDHYVICPDTPGRGLSQWSSDPEQQYVVPFYAQLAVDLLDQLNIRQCGWVGTSMGGLIGMVAALLAPERITRMVLNDVGPEVPLAAVKRIATYVGQQPEFDTLQALEAWQRQLYLPFGPNTDAFWQRMAMTSMRRKDNGKLTLHYDPAIALPFQHFKGETLWEYWPALACPLLIVRGEHSDVLLAEHAERMLRENPQAQLQIIAEVAHAPTLANAEQIALVADFLRA